MKMQNNENAGVFWEIEETVEAIVVLGNKKTKEKCKRLWQNKQECRGISRNRGNGLVSLIFLNGLAINGSA